MLRLVTDKREKKKLQLELERVLKASLPEVGQRNIGFPGGNVNLPIFSRGADSLWAAFGGETTPNRVRRFWNAFGLFDSDAKSQQIAVEFNIPTEKNSALVAAFFAEDIATGRIVLMHSGKIGGGRRGVSKAAFLTWLKVKLFEAIDADGNIRLGIPVCVIDDPDAAERIESFVRKVKSFKNVLRHRDPGTDGITEGKGNTRIYKQEFSGKKNSLLIKEIEYLTYHGDVVDAIYQEIIRRQELGVVARNDQLIDLFVERDGKCIEIYEVKTTTGRQALYTAIGQLLTHSARFAGSPKKFIVLPDIESVPSDISIALEKLSIATRRFQIRKATTGNKVLLE